MNVYTMKKTGRACYAFPWESAKAPCPWNQSQYERVVIPFTPAEQLNSRKKVHIQIVSRANLSLVKHSVPALV